MELQGWCSVTTEEGLGSEEGGRMEGRRETAGQQWRWCLSEGWSNKVEEEGGGENREEMDGR